MDEDGASIIITRLGAPLLRGRDAGGLLERLRERRSAEPLGPLDARICRASRLALNLGGERAIEAVFLDHQGRVLRIARVRPGRLRVRWGSAVVLEVAEGTPARLELGVDHVLLPEGGRW